MLVFCKMTTYWFWFREAGRWKFFGVPVVIWLAKCAPSPVGIGLTVLSKTGVASGNPGTPPVQASMDYWWSFYIALTICRLNWVRSKVKLTLKLNWLRVHLGGNFKLEKLCRHFFAGLVSI